MNAFGEDLDKELEALHLELKTGEYVPKPVRRVEIPKPKPDGSTRPLGVPTVRDRVVQQALLNVMHQSLIQNFIHLAMAIDRDAPDK